ncbi:Primosomal protein N' (replication factor Y) - superfamily II helicase [Minicystis rosea]|nr:Primosomal protein N' (replication factor Y) - superfamily II helicase [Minicystis rosea]
MDRRCCPPPRARRVLTLASVVVLALGVASPGVAFAGPGAGTSDATRARELHIKGKQAYQAGDMRGAYEAYAAAWALQKTFDVAANLAAVELATARFRDAAEHLTFALANLPVSGEGDKQRPVLVGMMADAKKQIGTITIKANADGASLTLDGRPVGTSPMADEIFLDPGEHTVGATAPSFAPVEQKIRVDKGAYIPVILTLKKIGEPPPVVPPPSGPSPITVAGFITAGVGLGAATALAIVSKTKADDASTQLSALEVKGRNACAGASPSPACVMLHDARASRDTFANAALWTFVGAGVVAAGTLVYTFAVPHTPATKTTGLSALPIVSPEGGGLLIKGAF